jgi:putative oxidoreductase
MRSKRLEGRMKNFWLVTVPRVVLGLIFLAGAIDGFSFIFTATHLIHPPTSDRGLQFEAALKATAFFWPLMKVVEITGAICLLSNRAPALGLAILSPIMTVVVLFHVFLNPQGIPLAFLLVICGALLLRAYAPRYATVVGSDDAEPVVVADVPQAACR